MERIAAGDLSQPLDELYRRYERRLYGLGLRLLGDQGLAEELVQGTFVRLWRVAGRFEAGKGSVSSFIFAIARRISIDLWRRPSSRPFEPGPAETSADPIEDVVVGLAVRDALEALSPAHRQVIELTHMRGLKQSEIAARVGVQVGTVKTRMHHALRALKRALEERGFDG